MLNAKFTRMRDLAAEISKFFPGALPPSPHAGEGLWRPSPDPSPSNAYISTHLEYVNVKLLL